jgi:hypothetical protein
MGFQSNRWKVPFSAWIATPTAFCPPRIYTEQGQAGSLSFRVWFTTEKRGEFRR